MIKQFLITLVFILTVAFLKAQSFDTTTVLNFIDSALVSKNDSAKTCELFVKANDISIEIAFIRGFVKSNNRLARYYDKLGYPIKALEILTSTIEYCKKKKWKEYLDHLHVEKNNIYCRLGDYKLAIENLQQAKLYIVDTNDRFDQKRGVIANNMGIIYKTQGMYVNAIESYKKAIKYSTVSANFRGKANAYLNLGLVYIATTKLDSALYFVKKANSISKEHNLKFIEAVSITTIGEVYANLNQLDSAKYYYTMVESNKFIKNNQFRLSGFYIKKGSLFFKEGNYDKSVQYCKQALEIADKIKFSEIRKSACGCLQRAYAKKGNYKKAFYYTNLKYEINAALLNTSIITTLGNIKYGVEIEKIEREAILSNLEKEKEKNLRLKIQNEFIEENITKKYLFVITAFISLVFFYLIYLYQKIKKQKKIIQRSLSEKELLLSEVHHRVKNNLQLISSILDLQSRSLANEEIKLVFKESQSKIAAISSIHQRLYQTEKFGDVFIDVYVKELSNAIISNLSNSEIVVEYQLDDFSLNLDHAIPTGLILTELLTNAIKYGYKNGLKLKIEFKATADNYVLTVWNSGDDYVLNSTKKSFGLNMISSLTKQLKGEFKITPKDGTLAELKIPHI